MEMHIDHKILKKISKRNFLSVLASSAQGLSHATLRCPIRQLSRKRQDMRPPESRSMFPESRSMFTESRKLFTESRKLFDPPIVEKTAGHVPPHTSRPGGLLAWEFRRLLPGGGGSKSHLVGWVGCLAPREGQIGG
jgi:hypothetical protein